MAAETKNNAVDDRSMLLKCSNLGLILDFCPIEDLYMFRGVCKAFRDECNDAMYSGRAWLNPDMKTLTNHGVLNEAAHIDEFDHSWMRDNDDSGIFHLMPPIFDDKTSAPPAGGSGTAYEDDEQVAQPITTSNSSSQLTSRIEDFIVALMLEDPPDQ